MNHSNPKVMDDLIIIGAGPGGYETAVLAAQNGLKTVIIEDKTPGGTCLNEGCIPTKALCRNAEVYSLMKNSSVYGFSANYRIDWNVVMQRKNEVVQTLVSGVEFLLKNKFITYVQGKAEFINSHTVKVGEETYSATNIMIATGSVTKYLPCEGLHLPGVLTSAEILDIDHLPTHLCVIGGGVIGLEFASIFNSFGCEVTVLEYAKEILPNFDTDISKRLKNSLKGKGINILNQASVLGVSRNGSNLSVHYDLKGTLSEVSADTVLLAVGRTPNLQSLNLDEVGITYTNKGIQTDENMQTNIPGIYAIGDINGRCMLAHAASYQGRRALNHILGKPDRIRFDVVPAAVFTVPEAASVGLTEDQCKVQGLKYKAKKSLFRANGKALSMNETDGMCKLIASDEGKILGCHLFGAHSADLVQEITALMNMNATVNDLQNIIHAHPTLGETVQEAARAFE